MSHALHNLPRMHGRRRVRGGPLLQEDAPTRSARPGDASAWWQGLGTVRVCPATLPVRRLRPRLGIRESRVLALNGTQGEGIDKSTSASNKKGYANACGVWIQSYAGPFCIIRSLRGWWEGVDEGAGVGIGGRDRGPWRDHGLEECWACNKCMDT